MGFRSYKSKDDLPCAGQTEETIRAWADKLALGDRVALRQSMGHSMFEYRLSDVEAFTDQDRRVLVRNHGTFWRSGKNCFHPKGQLSMIEPTPEVVEAAESRDVYQPG